MPPPKQNLIAATLFCVYLGINLGALLLAAQSQRQPRRYLNSTAVTLSELLKLITSILAIYAKARSTGAAAGTVATTLFGMPDQMLRVAIPSLLYTVQNNIIYAALAHLDAVSFQITYQLKIVAALLSSRLLLKKRVSPTRWLSVLLLTLGVVLVQLSLTPPEEAPSAPPPPPATAAPAAAAAAAPQTADGAGSSSGSSGAGPSSSGGAGSSSGSSGAGPSSSSSSGAGPSSAGSSSSGGEPRRNRALGLIGVLIACLCSGLAGSVMELLLKGTTLPLAERNLQVAAVSLLLATVHMLTNDAAALRANGFFQGYNASVWAMVSVDSIGGLLVSMLLKFTTATLKNFAAPLGIILNCLLSRYVLRSSNFKPNRHFILGTLLVLLSLGLHGSSA